LRPVRSLQRIHCGNEEKELQDLPERNLDLPARDQINPDDPRRWFLVKREIPVPDPSSGGDRCSIDFFLVDQLGMPTFVESKRFADTRSRREVIGQMLEYAANGQYYWERDDLIKYAEESTKWCRESLEDAINDRPSPRALKNGGRFPSSSN
jgi:hypothetical protein